jgi:hypothetical protein
LGAGDLGDGPGETGRVRNVGQENAAPHQGTATSLSGKRLIFQRLCLCDDFLDLSAAFKKFALCRSIAWPKKPWLSRILTAYCATIGFWPFRPLRAEWPSSFRIFQQPGL